MATVTVEQCSPPSLYKQQQLGCYLWPNSKPASEHPKSQSFAIRVVNSTTNPSLAQTELTNASPDIIQDEVRESQGTGSAHPFPSRKHHSRTKSATAVGELLAFPVADAARRRARAASSATIGAGAGSHSRPRLPSMLASVLTHQKAPAEPCALANDPGLVGSFTPTSSPRPRLQSFLSLSDASFPSSSQPAPPPPSSSPPCASFHADRPTLSRRRSPRLHSSEYQTHIRCRSVPAPPTPVDLPTSSNLPSICRTPSSYSGSDYFPTAPSSGGPPTPVHATTALPNGRRCESLHPVLEILEKKSKFYVKTECATCGQCGSNFPCCPKCGDMWCSRACRMRGGKRHICAERIL